MKFGKEFTSQMVPEWQEAYMNYNFLKILLKDLLIFRQRQARSLENSQVKPPSKAASLKRRGSLFRAFSGLTSRYGYKNLGKDKDDEVILVNAMHTADEERGDDGGRYQTTFLRSSEDGGEYEYVFFRRLDDEFNKVVKFYKAEVEEVVKHAEELNRQMDAFIALRIKVNDPAAVSPFIDQKITGYSMDVIHEEEQEKRPKDGNEIQLASLEVLNHVKINNTADTPLSAIKSVFHSSKSGLHFKRNELRDVKEKLKAAFIEFHEKLRFLKSYVFLNQLAFSKIMKKYDKITSRNASGAYLHMVEESYLGQSDEVAKLIERVEAAFVKHFFNGNRHQGMSTLKPNAKKKKHRVTFFVGCFFGCSLALIVAIIVSVHNRDLLTSETISEGRTQYMDTIFPLYTLFGFVVLHMLMYAGNVYYWTLYRVNYSFIFGFKPGTELGFTEVLLLSSSLSVLALAAAFSNLEMELDQNTGNYEGLTELVPLILVIVVLLITFCPFNIFYRANRFLLLVCLWHCICAPFYAITLPDFFVGDQFTSQVQSLRSMQFYVCYYAWGDYKKRNAESCFDSDVYKIIYIVVAVIPYWIRFLQCIRRLWGGRDSTQALNALKYFSIIIAVVARTLQTQMTVREVEGQDEMTEVEGQHEMRGVILQIIAGSTSVIATLFATYWDLVMDWGLLRRNSVNPWLRDKLILPKKSTYFIAMVLNMILRLAWMQTVLQIYDTPFLHKNVMIAIVACLEIIRRGLWNFFRLENEHLNNVGNFRAVKSVPLPFSYEQEDKNL